MSGAVAPAAGRGDLKEPRENSSVVNDPTAFQGTASYYTIGRPPYSLQLRATLIDELGLDGVGRLLDVGCGPGVLVVELADLFDDSVALDPDEGMLSEGRRRAQLAEVSNIRWIQGVAEDIARLDLGPCRLVTFGQSFHRTERYRVAESVYDLLEPEGGIALVAHTVEGRPIPPGTGHPRIPDAEVQELIARYLGSRVPTGCAVAPERWEESLAKTRFGVPQVVFAPGRPDLVRHIDSVVAGYFSMSYAAPRLFGDKRASFENDLRALLRKHSSTGLFWDWPGDTEILIARK